MKKATHEDRVKFGALVVLVLQTTMLAMVARFSRTQPGPMYLVSTVVVISEAVKFAASLVLVMVEQGGVMTGLRHAGGEVCSRPAETIKMLVPALLFTMQNNLGYFALTHLDVATYQVLYQLKILTTALFSVLLLRRSLRWAQWGSLLLLVAGVALVQLSTLKSGSKSMRDNSFLGLCAVLASCVSSGLAGVWFEKVLKASIVSVWVRNAQLAAFSILVGLANVYFMDGTAVAAQGFLYGFNPIVWTAVGLQAGGGLIVAVVIKRADNVVKGFATSASIVLSTFLSVYLQDFIPGPSFFLGAALVTVATLLYGIETEVLWRWVCCEVPKAADVDAVDFESQAAEEEEGIMLMQATEEVETA